MRAAFAGLTALTLLAGCGFHLRGTAQLPFETIYIPGSNPLAVELRRNVAAASKTRLADNPKNAQAVLAFTQETREKIILTFTSAGKVNEYRLRYRVGFRVTDSAGAQVFVPTSEILLTRDMSYNDQQVIAKENEETLLYRDMQTDMVQQIMRRLVAARPQVE
jgi:LPS-assembly lipoprotein